MLNRSGFIDQAGGRMIEKVEPMRLKNYMCQIESIDNKIIWQANWIWYPQSENMYLLEKNYDDRAIKV